jgi:hypothetical protein
MKNTEIIKNKVSSHTKVATGVYKTPTGKYVVRPTINGVRKTVSFTNKAKAIKYYKSL